MKWRRNKTYNNNSNDMEIYKELRTELYHIKEDIRQIQDAIESLKRVAVEPRPKFKDGQEVSYCGLIYEVVNHEIEDLKVYYSLRTDREFVAHIGESFLWEV